MLTQLKYIRMTRGITQWKLSHELECAESTLSRIENGRCKPNQKTRENLEAKFDMTFEELMRTMKRKKA